MLSVAISIVGSFVASMVSLVIWFHFDLEGYMEQKRHARIMRVGERNSQRKETRIDA